MDKQIKSIQRILKIPSHDPHVLIQAFKKREEVEHCLQEMKPTMRLNEEECKKSFNQL